MELFEYLWQYLEFISVVDIVDIAIVAYILYKVIHLIRQTTASRLLKGVILIILAIQLADLLGLNVISYLFSNFMELGLILLVVLFQPELRKMIEQVGKSRIGIFNSDKGSPSSTTLENAIAETVDACTGMSWTKTGALIVFERNDSLGDLVKNGTVIDAAVSCDLLKSIFYHNAPLHDGAVVIKNARIQSTRCVLPLSGNLTLSHELGTRHRAAVGISEVSDAIAVVVSEETGSISVAIGGTLKRHLMPDTLENILKGELKSETAKKKSLKNLFRFGGEQA